MQTFALIKTEFSWKTIVFIVGCALALCFLGEDWIYPICCAGIIFCFYHAFNIRWFSVPLAVFLSSFGLLMAYAVFSFSDFDEAVEAIFPAFLPVYAIILVDFLISRGIENRLVKHFLFSVPILFIVGSYCYFIAYQWYSIEYLYLWIAEAIIWVAGLKFWRPYSENPEEIPWLLWLLTILMFWAFVIRFDMDELYWGYLITLSLPVICVLFFWHLLDCHVSDEYLQLFVAGFLFIFLCLLFLSTIVIGYIDIAQKSMIPIVSFYILVCGIVLGAIGHVESDVHHPLLLGYIHIFGIIYILLTLFGVFTLLVNGTGSSTFTNVLWEVGSWLDYHVACAESYFCGDLGPVAQFLDYDISDNSFFNKYRYGNTLYAIGFQYGWWWLLIAMAVVIVVSVIMLSRQFKSYSLNLMKNILAVSYIIRVILYFIVYVFMIEGNTPDLPFGTALAAPVDFMILYYIFDYKQRYERARLSEKQMKLLYLSDWYFYDDLKEDEEDFREGGPEKKRDVRMEQKYQKYLDYRRSHQNRNSKRKHRF